MIQKPNLNIFLSFNKKKNFLTQATGTDDGDCQEEMIHGKISETFMVKINFAELSKVLEKFNFKSHSTL